MLRTIKDLFVGSRRPNRKCRPIIRVDQPRGELRKCVFDATVLRVFMIGWPEGEAARSEIGLFCPWCGQVYSDSGPKFSGDALVFDEDLLS